MKARLLKRLREGARKMYRIVPDYTYPSTYYRVQRNYGFYWITLPGDKMTLAQAKEEIRLRRQDEFIDIARAFMRNEIYERELKKVKDL